MKWWQEWGLEVTVWSIYLLLVSAFLFTVVLMWDAQLAKSKIRARDFGRECRKAGIDSVSNPYSGRNGEEWLRGWMGVAPEESNDG